MKPKNDIATRRSFIKGTAGLCAGLLCPGCVSFIGGPRTKVAVQLYSLHEYIAKAGLDDAFRNIKEIGYEGVEFAGYYNYAPEKLKSMLADNGLSVCGSHLPNQCLGFDVKNWVFDEDVLKKTCAFELAYGNNLVICPDEGNIPPGVSYKLGRGAPPVKPSESIDDFIRHLAEFYNKASIVAKAEGCRIGLHNHTWEHCLKLTTGQSFWDYFFSNTCTDVCMEQDVGWSTCAGVDPCLQYLKYPGRSPTLHAKENGMGVGVKTFDAILGQPGRPGATPVAWDRLFPITDADGVEWYVVECERHFDTLDAVKPSWDFLHAKGRC